MHKDIIAVTGSNGYIGSHLVKELTERGYHVYAITRRNINLRKENDRVTWISIYDTSDEHEWAKLLVGASCVIHLAGTAHSIGLNVSEKVKSSYQEDLLMMQALTKAVSKSVTIARFIFISSIAAICSKTDRVLNENISCTPDTEYGRTKLMAETICRDNLSATKADWCIIRPPLVYGPDNPGNMERLRKLVSLHMPIPLGKYVEKRSLLYVKNLVEFVLICLFSKKASRQIYLISDGDDISVVDILKSISLAQNRRIWLISPHKKIIEIIAGALDSFLLLIGDNKRPFRYSLERLDNPVKINPHKAFTELNWKPRFSAREGLDKTFKYTEYKSK